jgi:peptidoglycan/LPS O-acetylase OafA/YrhL
MKQELKALTALRGIAAMAVVLQHFSTSAQGLTSHWIPSLAPHGYMAVDFFFVLSGFIMAYTYAEGFQVRGLQAYPDFLVRRFARIWPLQALVVLLIVIATLIVPWLSEPSNILDHDNWGLSVAANILMVQGFGIGLNLNGPSATVSLEFAAYILFPVLLAIALHRRKWIAFLGFCISAILICWEASLEPRFALEARDVANLVVRCLTEFTLGLGAYRLYLTRGATWLAADWLAAGLAGACVGSLLLRLDLPAALLFPLVVAAFARNQGWPARLVGMPWPHFVGVVSYSLYLVHSPLRFAEFTLVRYIHPGQFGPAAAIAIAAVGALSMLPVAWISYRWVEQPGRILFRRVGLAPARRPLRKEV